MNFDSLYFPIDLVDFIKSLKDSKRLHQGGNGDVHFLISESLLCEMLLKLGAIGPVNSDLKSGEAIKNEYIDQDVVQVFANEEIDAALGEVELEDRCAGEGNAIRWVMNHYRMSLKEIAIRYGGKSAASNIANYLSKSDCELMAVRNSTIRRIAEALEISASEFETLVALRCENASSLGTSEKHLDT